MRFPLSTGQAAQLLGTTEPRLAHTVRKGRIEPEPLVFAGRRLWHRDQLIQAARALGLDDDETERRLDAVQEVPHAS